MSEYASSAPEQYTVDENSIVVLFSAFKSRQSERDDRMSKIDKVVKGDFSVFDGNGDDVENRSPNLIQVALEDTAESAGTMPTIRISPCKAGSRAREQASKQERIGAGYLDAAGMDILLTETIMDLAGMGHASWVVWPDFEMRLPLIERLDPRMVYPDPDYKQGRVLRRAMVVRELRLGQLPAQYKDKLADFGNESSTSEAWRDENEQIILVDFWTESDYTCAVLFQTTQSGLTQSTDSDFRSVILEQWKHSLGVCPVVYEQRITLDKQARGQFDQVIDPFEAHVRLMGLVLDYADQAVYSDVWVKDLIGEMSFGGGAYIELGPNGAIGRVPPAVNSFNVQQDIERLVDSIHLGARWPKSRPGEVDQSIASAKFIEAAAGMMNTALKTYHQLMQHMLERALRVGFAVDQKFFPGKKSATGVLRNQEFVEEYDSSKDIDVRNRVRVEYGLGLGRDPGQSAILMLQYAQNGYISDDFVQENIEGVSDVDRERRRLDLQKFRQMALAKLLQGLEQGTIPESALVAIAKARDDGQDLFDLYEKFIVVPQQQQPFSGVPSAAIPGVPPSGGPTSAPPGAPGQAGVQPPAAPDPSQMFQRLDSPAGPGGKLGVQTVT